MPAIVYIHISPGDCGVQEVLFERFQPLSVGCGQCEDLFEARPPDLPSQEILKLHVVAVETIPFSRKYVMRY